MRKGKHHDLLTLFLNNKASSIVSYSKAKEYKFDRDD